ncbi:Prp19/Pso4-like-domain-containing protein [Dipodascopsis tothii]|uniref:Prp19/Pso4-like-domain-containing protein n=1 Tax=Dipodascopsis tothii TaxID=44089 RepID=UPI0034CE7A13
MNCALSNEPIPPSVAAVVSPRSGRVFARPALEAHLREHGRDPITDEELALDELVEIAPAAGGAGAAVAGAGLPALLRGFTSEYDAVALQNFQLRLELEKTRRELASTLYMHDAAVRVAARVKGERDAAVAQAAQLRGA